MSTADALLRVDAGVFEMLATGYLRRYDPRLGSLITTGINEEGKSIPCPVDAITYTPSVFHRRVDDDGACTTQGQMDGRCREYRRHREGGRGTR